MQIQKEHLITRVPRLGEFQNADFFQGDSNNLRKSVDETGIGLSIISLTFLNAWKQGCVSC